jgi:hypothetical protein
MPPPTPQPRRTHPPTMRPRTLHVHPRPRAARKRLSACRFRIYTPSAALGAASGHRRKQVQASARRCRVSAASAKVATVLVPMAMPPGSLLSIDLMGVSLCQSVRGSGCCQSVDATEACLCLAAVCSRSSLNHGQEPERPPAPEACRCSPTRLGASGFVKDQHQSSTVIIPCTKA